MVAYCYCFWSGQESRASSVSSEISEVASQTAVDTGITHFQCPIDSQSTRPSLPPTICQTTEML